MDPKIGGVIVSHGQVANELLSAAETVVGELRNITAVSIGWHDDVEAAGRGLLRRRRIVGGARDARRADVERAVRCRRTGRRQRGDAAGCRRSERHGNAETVGRLGRDVRRARDGQRRDHRWGRRLSRGAIAAAPGEANRHDRRDNDEYSATRGW